MTDPGAIAADGVRDQKLAQLLEELTNQLRQGQRPRFEVFCQNHPDLAQELRELWAAVEIAEEFGKAAGAPQATVDAPPPAAETLAAPSTTVDLPRVFGDYELLEMLGEGGMGVVYKARQRSLDRLVAVKMLLRGKWASVADLGRFRAEAEAAARLEHPHIVAVYQVGESDGQAFFSMQYIEGRTLASLVAEGPLPPREAARCLVPVCRAVHYAHQHGILHRDLKPANVLLDQNGQPHVTDFGLAKRVQGGASLTQSGAIVGTPSYMAPEQATGSRGVLSPASDVYSLGTILYELLTGRVPFRAASAVDTLFLVLDQEPVPPRLLNPKVDPELEIICLKCLQKPADLRYATAEQLAGDLEAYLQGEALSVRPSGLGYLISRVFRETHHAAVLENWGLLWMWHSLKIFLLCVLTNWLHWQGITQHWVYLAFWGIGLITWGSIVWTLRRRGGPVFFIERQIAHLWSGAIIASIGTFIVEVLLGLPALKLSPILALLAGLVFVVKGGMLSGSFYFYAAALFATAVLMALLEPIGPLLFGCVSALSFFIPGLKYYRQRIRSAAQAK
ncbi:MAG: serine/threonine protein kinase [Gemmataceae bacterium]|nr:serine/threonine protein kinase [Gemmataceae bacterium]